MGDPLPLVNRVIATYEEHVLRMDPGPVQDRRHEELTALKKIVKEVVERRNIMEPLPAEFGDLSDLPEELRAELTVTKVPESDSQIFTVINAAGGRADLDKILVGLYRKFKVVGKRRALANKLWRMAQREDGTLWADPDSKGVYLTYDPEKRRKEEEAERLQAERVKFMSQDEPSLYDDMEIEDSIPF